MDLETAQKHLDAWLDCELALATAQEYALETPSGSQRVQRVQLPEVRKQIRYWKDMIASLSGKKRRRFSHADFNSQ